MGLLLMRSYKPALAYDFSFASVWSLTAMLWINNA